MTVTVTDFPFGYGSNFVANSIFNVATFGAKGDGVTDDTVAIQSTINACIARGGGVVYIPTGTYYVTKCLYVAQAALTQPVSGITIVGDGRSTQIWPTAGMAASAGGPANYVWWLFGTPNAQLRDMQIVHLAYAGAPTTHADKTIHIEACTNNVAGPPGQPGCIGVTISKFLLGVEIGSLVGPYGNGYFLLRDMIMQPALVNGSGIVINLNSGGILENVQCAGAGSGAAVVGSTGLTLTGSMDSLFLTDCLFGGFHNCCLIEPSGASFIANIWMEHVIFGDQYANSALIVNPSGTATVSVLYFNDCFFQAYGTAIVMQQTGSGVVNDVRFNGVQCASQGGNAGGAAVFINGPITGPYPVVFNGGSITCNGTGGNGIEFGSGAQFFRAFGVEISGIYGLSVKFDTANLVDIVFDGCRFANAVGGTGFVKGGYATGPQITIRNSVGMNPFGYINTTPAFPATGVTYKNNGPFDITAYISNGSGVLVIGGVLNVPASASIAIPLVVGQTFTPVYTSGTPIWGFVAD